MDNLTKFLRAVKDEFPDDRLTHQKGLPTFHPENADEAARFIKISNRLEQSIYIAGYGNNLDPVGESFDGLVIIKTDRLNTCEEVAAEDFYVRVGSGYPLREINRRLAENSLYLPHSALPYVGSIGGAVAVNLGGTMAGVSVPIKKYLIKATVVTPLGQIITPGSVCFKSVSGYDIVKIFASSWGLLGLIISATFRVMPISGAEDFTDWSMQAVDRTSVLGIFDKSVTDPDAIYTRKIKEKFDPNHLLPPLIET